MDVMPQTGAGASTGQTSEQAPQSMQRSVWMSYWVSPSEIALDGHSGSQAPQLMHASEILYAMHIPSIPVLAHFITSRV
jgi:hypothetical protein